jgi:hypothetical protein
MGNPGVFRCNLSCHIEMTGIDRRSDYYDGSGDIQ